MRGTSEGTLLIFHFIFTVEETEAQREGHTVRLSTSMHLTVFSFVADWFIL